MIKKPMLAVDCGDTATLQYPLYATPKLDGIRCMKVDGCIVSRNFKPIPNTHIRNLLEQELLEGADGEICLRSTMAFNEVSSAVMRETGVPDFVYYMFDLYSTYGYKDRMNLMRSCVGSGNDIIIPLYPVTIRNEEGLLAYETDMLGLGYEGVMVRTGNSPYKFGRSTVKEGYLLKVKRFTDSEAIVLGFVEQKRNDNEAKKDAFGRTKRSSHKENMIPAGTLGALEVRDIHTGVEFEVGGGFSDALRKEIWDNKMDWRDSLIKYKSQKSGEKDKPRFPVFLGKRSPNDM